MNVNIALATFGTRAWADSFAPWYRIYPVNDGIRNDEDETGRLSQMRWLSQPTFEPHWVVLLFPGKQLIESVSIFWARDQGSFLKPKRYWLEYWEENEWKKIEEISREEAEDGKYTHIVFSPLEVDRIHLFMPEGGGKPGEMVNVLGVAEIEIYSSSPHKGQTSSVIVLQSSLKSRANPFWINWEPIPQASGYVVQYSRDKNFVGEDVETVKVKQNYFMPTHYLQPGRWYCRVAPILKSGIGEWSNPMAIEVGEINYIPHWGGPWKTTHPRLPWTLIDREKILEEVKGPKKHIWETIERLAQDKIKHVAQLKNMQSTEKEEEELPEEPPSFENGVWNIQRWREIVGAAAKVLEALTLYSYMYAVTRDKKYSERAKTWLLHAAKWDPMGSTGIDSVDHAAHDVLVGLSIGYDILYHELSKEERELVKNAIEARCRVLWRYLNPFVLDETNNHPWFQTNALAIGALTIWDEVEEARDWIDFAIQLYVGRFLPLGGVDGDWHEGSDYWTYTMGFVIEFIEAIYAVTGINLSDHPWLKKTAAFKLYVAPPGGAGLSFGDTHKRPPNGEDAAIMFYLARTQNNPYAQWYGVEALKNDSLIRPALLIRLMNWWDTSVPSKAPLDLPLAKHFRESGIIVAHTTLEHQRGTHFAFKSGPYHGIMAGHEHADQNSFMLYAAGDPIIVDSGVYDYYGSPHYYGWYVRTVAHNTILVDGEGQICQKPGADGEILHFLHSDTIDYFEGNAAPSYKGLIDSFVRKILFLRPSSQEDSGDLGLLIMFDHIVSQKQRNISSLIHTAIEPNVVIETIDRTVHSVSAKGENANLSFYIKSKSPLIYMVRKGYAQDIAPSNNSLKEYHIDFTTENKTAETTFLSVFDLNKIASQSAYVNFVNESAVLIEKGVYSHFVAFGDSYKELAYENFRTDGKVFVQSSKEGKLSSLLIIQGTYLYQDKRLLLRSENPIDIIWNKIENRLEQLRIWSRKMQEIRIQEETLSVENEVTISTSRFFNI
ncbi:DUF4962 domain-containing protein [Thermoanaerobacter indiensis]|uniref:DUF4962 domain-containing protein n=1 Tax=Thermoanaerobacter indiensis TaxID=1125974 RepID=UPI0003822EA8|nr:DUF4962 domain-containing protein [Thermoanaerobacter indiensis]